MLKTYRNEENQFIKVKLKTIHNRDKQQLGPDLMQTVTVQEDTTEKSTFNILDEW